MALDGVEDAMMQQVLAFPPHPPPAQPSSDAAYHAGIRHVVETLASCPASKLTAAISGKNKILDVSMPCRRADHADHYADRRPLCKHYSIPIRTTSNGSDAA